MTNSEFWLMVKREDNGLLRIHDSSHPRHLLPKVSLVELTSDELVYVWPRIPKFETLCMVCLNLRMRCHDICQAEVLPGYPCRFEAVPESEQCQDFDDFLIDGEFLAECGYYSSFEEFTQIHGFTEYDFSFYRIGEFSSIRAARQALCDLRIFFHENM